jgi:hypothetical protein
MPPSPASNVTFIQQYIQPQYKMIYQQMENQPISSPTQHQLQNDSLYLHTPLSTSNSGGLCLSTKPYDGRISLPFPQTAAISAVCWKCCFVDAIMSISSIVWPSPYSFATAPSLFYHSTISHLPEQNFNMNIELDSPAKSEHINEI